MVARERERERERESERESALHVIHRSCVNEKTTMRTKSLIIYTEDKSSGLVYLNCDWPIEHQKRLVSLINCCTALKSILFCS
jgi:hypothetical protein